MVDLIDFYKKIIRSKHNVDFNDFKKLIEKAGYQFSRQKGSHLLYHHPEIAKINYLHSTLSIQDRKGKAKPAQLKQFCTYVEEYGLLKEQ